MLGPGPERFFGFSREGLWRHRLQVNELAVRLVLAHAAVGYERREGRLEVGHPMHLLSHHSVLRLELLVLVRAVGVEAPNVLLGRREFLSGSAIGFARAREQTGAAILEGSPLCDYGGGASATNATS